MAKLMNGLGLEEEPAATETRTMPSALHQSLGISPNPDAAPASTNGHAGDHSTSNGHAVQGEEQEMELLEDSGFEPEISGRWKPFFIGVAGGTASGKTSVCHKIMGKLGQNDLDHEDRRVVTISSDSFYRVLEQEERGLARKGEFNFDHPDALDYKLIIKTMETLLAGKIANIPVYDFVTHSRKAKEFIKVHPADVVLFEGILVFYFTELRNLFQLKLFVDTDADTRLARRVVRDLKDRGRDLPSVIHQYTLFVKPAFEEFCQPTKKYADVIIPRGADNEVAINLIVQHIKEHLLPLAQENGSPRRSSQEDAAVIVDAIQKQTTKNPKPRLQPLTSSENNNSKVPLVEGLVLAATPMVNGH